jgi:alpha-L-fucosidase 2
MTFVVRPWRQGGLLEQEPTKGDGATTSELNLEHTVNRQTTRCLLVVIVVSFSATLWADPGPMVLWYDEPAGKWVEANPTGNGRLGAMVFGGTEKERIQINDDTLWFGEPHDYAHEGAVEHLDKIRKLLFEGNQGEAQKLAGEQFMSVPLRQMAYQPCCDLLITQPDHKGVVDYRRELDIGNAISTVTYEVGDITYTRTLLVSNPDDVIVVRIEADKPGKVSFSATLDTPHEDKALSTVGKNELAMRGRVRTTMKRQNRTTVNPLHFETRVAVSTDGGKATVTDESIEVAGANSATLVLTTATNYVDFEDVSGDPTKRCAATLQAVADKSYEAIKRDHIADYRELFDRVTLDLGVTDKVKLPTDQRIKAFGDGDDPQLATLYYQFGRYLMIASSRPGTQPANLQGIWNESPTPPWECKYTTNINTEMNYWPAEMCNLAECHLALFDALEEIAISGARVAKEHYGARGWVLHHNFDLWRGAAPINASNHGIWPTGGAWLTQHLWWHYEYSGDKTFLRERAYPLLKGSAEFFLDYLVEDPRNDKGWLISGPSNSPENGGLVMGPTMDHQIIRELFANTAAAAKVLGVDEDLQQKLLQARGRIAPNQIGQHGQLQEWLEDKDSPSNRHRHVSHLWGLHPGSEINANTPELFDAAKVTLAHRGDGGTGWSKSWKVNFWARLLDGDHSYLMLSSLIATGTYPNMFDAHPPFQIDGNFGGTSGMTEMLLQNHLGEIAILPALPSAWPTGGIEGIRARGGVEVDIQWKDGEAVSVSLTAKLDGTHQLRAPKGQQIAKIERGGKTTAVGKDLAEVAVKKGETVRVLFK